MDGNNFSKARYLGIDCGKEGGLAWLDADGALLGVCKMPKNTEDDTDFIALAKMLRKFPSSTHVITEHLHAIKGVGAKQTFAFARQFAILECAIRLSRLPWTMVNPKKWQSKMWLGQKMITKEIKLDKEGTKKLKTDTKKISENTFRKLFPQHVNDPLIRKKSGNLRDGIVDATLMALYAKRESL